MLDLTFSPKLRQTIQQRLSRLEVVTHSDPALRTAAIALVVVELRRDPKVYDIEYQPDWADHAAIILTQRAAKLNRHAGQWALPGGRIDRGESPAEAAIRELNEEVGVTLQKDDIIGRLDDFTTRSGFIIKPFVFWGGAVTALRPDPHEVAYAHRLPVNELLRPDSPILETIPESNRPVLKMPIGNNWVAAPTGAVLYQFREVAIFDKQTRVAHFEQPKFAWK